MRNFDDRIENAGATAPGRLSAAEDNVRFKEMENLGTSAGITLDPQAGPDTDFTMLSQAVAKYASGGVFGTCSGTANTYVVAITGSFTSPKSLFTGMVVHTRPSATNTGPTTANVFGLGSKKVLTYAGAALVGGELVANRDTQLVYDTSLDSGAGAWRIVPWAMVPPNPAGLVYGSLVTIQHQETGITVNTRAFSGHIDNTFPAQNATLTNPFSSPADLICIGGGGNNFGWTSRAVIGNWRPTANGLDVAICSINDTDHRSLYAPLMRVVASNVAGGANTTVALDAVHALLTDGNNTETTLTTWAFYTFLWARRAT